MTSARPAATRSCVAMTTVAPVSADASRRARRTRSAPSLSISAVGSSASNTEGELARATATATRCCSPPESIWGRNRARSSSPRSSSSSSARRALDTAEAPASTMGSRTFCVAVRYGTRFFVAPCHRNPTSRRRKRARSRSSSSPRSLPPTQTVPAVGASTPPMRFRMLDFPAPLGPTMAANMPSPTSRVTPPSAATPVSPTR